MSDHHVHIVFAGGGTGGHIFPALAIADAVRVLRPDADILFIGTRDKIESRVVPRSGYRFGSIWISGFQRGLTVRNLLFPIKVLVSLIQSYMHLRRFKPDVAIGTGGYVSGPVLWVASVLGVPVVLHESNSTPGAATRLMARRAQMVFTAFPVTGSKLPQADHVRVVGTPVRQWTGHVSKSDALERFGLDPTKKTLLVLGGSLGAASINQAVLGLVDQLLDGGIQLVWQTGRFQDTAIQQALAGRNPGWVGPFIDDMEYAYASADLALCRAGAATVAELTATGTPAILVPYPRATDDHQTLNARALDHVGAAVMIPDSDLGAKLLPTIAELITDSERRKTMHQAALALAKADAARVIATAILELAA